MSEETNKKIYPNVWVFFLVKHNFSSSGEPWAKVSVPLLGLLESELESVISGLESESDIGVEFGSDFLPSPGIGIKYY